MKIHSVETEFFHTNGQTDMTKLTGAFSQFCEKRLKFPLCINCMFFILSGRLCSKWSPFRYIYENRRHSWLVIGNRLRAERPGVRFPARQVVLLSSNICRPTVDSTQPPVQWVMLVLSLGVKRPETEHKATTRLI
jgi:hypothetical protein